MKSKWLKLILVASLALNLAFTVPYIHRRFFGPKPPPRIERNIRKLEKSLNLGKEQKEKIDIIIKNFRLELMQYKQDVLEKRIDIIDELGDPEFDPENITTLTNELNELENRLNLLFLDTVIQVSNVLEQQQRLDFLYKISKNWFFIDKNRHHGKNTKRRQR